ncbi:MAG: protein kinase, partial [Bifidobacterium castoris]|nr:protein kinase [Bifidobacterium castoris]
SARHITLKYFPTTFVVEYGVVHYVDFECRPYKDTRDFENWGVKYWSKTPEFLTYVAEHMPQAVNSVQDRQ